MISRYFCNLCAILLSRAPRANLIKLMSSTRRLIALRVSFYHGPLSVRMDKFLLKKNLRSFKDYFEKEWRGKVKHWCNLWHKNIKNMTNNTAEAHFRVRKVPQALKI